MRTTGLHGQQCAGHFVLALCAPFKTRYARLNAPFNRLVIAGLKVQTVHTLQGTPIATIGNFVVDANEAGGHSSPLFFSNEQDPVFGHGVLHAFKKIAIQIGGIAVFKISLGIALVKEIPIRACDVDAFKRMKTNACLLHFAALLLDFFALFLVECLKKMIKVFIVMVMPMKLNGVSA